ncbi:hypothetical protein GCM10025882_05640 [Acinetobacter gyllenbergii]|uniref:Ig-like domain-containing protein n=1 Tax=Acinetobacter gyllenbergii CIP 110306 = MTCC 11365 TaxID=1217657 RepID=A0A829HK83_9GAMM|nr:hypothetical protein [Acinetobacter gyllenbergii]EPF93118.1 hypothetical protein F957_00464 [Acinetobacter gyllenbergii CIP 110306 = MTCC 11365]EPH31428.1 putative signal peptide protein [Acinetobacter gyllenbergii CIP 110306 = MTCC 11365]MCU4579731.1 hypothetical protein [Acinetobacter gyllenbergii]GMA10140.1 hypothetical protein GCM10025882_05640 [Acinetobacter gyllenbergii]
MTQQKFKTILFSCISAISFTACSSLSTPNNGTQTLQQVKNIGATPSTEGNTAKLSKQGQHCNIEFTGYFDGGQAVEQWVFNQNGLISASSTTQHYQDKTLAQPTTATAFDVQDATVQANFQKLQSNFSADKLTQCH